MLQASNVLFSASLTPCGAKRIAELLYWIALSLYRNAVLYIWNMLSPHFKSQVRLLLDYLSEHPETDRASI